MGATGREPGPVEARLLRRWRGRFTSRWGGAGDAVGGEIVDRYGEPWRRYHTVDHLSAVLGALDELSEGRPSITVELAAWFHDAVYDPAAGDNEERSRDLAVHRLGGLGMAPTEVAVVGELVMATKAHDPGDLAGAAVLLDADLSILGADAATYDAYARAIREEYAHVPDDRYLAGRAAVLQSFLSRDRLFLTASGRARFEAAARANLARELASLRTG